MKRVCNYKGHIKISLSDNTHRLNFLKIGARAGSKAAQLVIVAVAVQQPLRRQPVHIARYALCGAWVWVIFTWRCRLPLSNTRRILMVRHIVSSIGSFCIAFMP